MKIAKYIFILLISLNLNVFSQEQNKPDGTVADLLSESGAGHAKLSLDPDNFIRVENDPQQLKNKSLKHQSRLRHKTWTKNNVVTHHLYKKSYREKGKKVKFPEHNLVSYDYRDRSRWAMKMKVQNEKNGKFHAEVFRFDYNGKIRRMSVCKRDGVEYCVKYTQDFCKTELPAVLSKVDEFDKQKNKSETDFDKFYDELSAHFTKWSNSTGLDRAKMIRSLRQASKISDINVPDNVKVVNSKESKENRLAHYFEYQKVLSIDLKNQCDKLVEGNYFRVKFKELLKDDSSTLSGANQ